MMLRALGFVVATFVAAPALAETKIMSAPEISDALAQNEMILLDIRSRDEWKETGLAQGAWPVSMHEKDFAQRLQTILANYAPDTVAIICATGGRTSYIADILKKNGIEGVADVSEGMMGNSRGAGWIARGLPVVTLEEATAAYETSLPPE